MKTTLLLGMISLNIICNGQYSYTGLNSSIITANDTVTCMASHSNGTIYIGTSGYNFPQNTARLMLCSNGVDVIYEPSPYNTNPQSRFTAMGVYTDNNLEKILFFTLGSTSLRKYNPITSTITGAGVNSFLNGKVETIIGAQGGGFVGGKYSFYEGGNSSLTKYSIGGLSGYDGYIYNGSLIPDVQFQSNCYDVTKTNGLTGWNNWDTLYIAGDFIQPSGNSNIIKCFNGSGSNPPSPFSIYSGGTVSEIQLYHDTLFFVQGNNVYKMSPNGGSPVFATSISNVHDIEIYDDKLFFGGSSLIEYSNGAFSTLIDASNLDGEIYSLKAHSSNLFIGGNFISINGNASLNKICKIESVQPPTTAFTLNTSTTCEGLAVTIPTNTTTGTGTLTYLWSVTNGTFSGSVTAQNPGVITFTTSGMQTITLTATNDGGSTVYNQNVTVNANPVPVITNASTTTFCNGESVLLNTGTYSSYSWGASDTTVTTSGSYSVTVADANGCEGTSVPVVVTVNSNPSPSITGSFAYCEGDSTQLSTGNYSNYSWSNGGNIQNPYMTFGTYSVTVTDNNGCIGTSSSVTVTENVLPTPTITSSGSDLISSETSGNQWYFNNGIISGANSQLYSPVSNGDYTVEVTDMNNCVGVSSVFTVVSVGIAEHYSQPDVYSYDHGQLTVHKGVWRLYDLSGRIILNGNVGTYTIPVGNYFLITEIGSARIVRY